MLFPSVPFLFYFLPIFLALYALIPARNAVLLAGSILFYAWGDLANLWVLGLSMGFTYGVGLRVAGNRRWLAVGVTGQLLLLSIFKYGGFILATLAGLVPSAPLAADSAPSLPLGISFFTFHALSYLIDVYRGAAPPARRFSDLALYILLFPQLIAGPIVRFHSLHRQIARRWLTLGRFRIGAELMLIGLLQKLVLADTLAKPVDAIYALDPAWLSAKLAWIAASLYTLQLYLDFSGYSHMAMGLALMLGFRFPRNFNYPLRATSVSEFWRRWHISLSRWFRDYLYLPLGGSRTGKARTILNLAIVFLLCGLWHGAGWNFILWGAYNGAFLIIERLVPRLTNLPRPLGQMYTLLVTIIGLVLIRVGDLAEAMRVYTAMLGAAQPEFITSAERFLSASTLAAMGIAALSILPIARLRPRTSFAAPRWPWGRFILGVVALGWIGMILAQGSYSPFLYFRF